MTSYGRKPWCASTCPIFMKFLERYFCWVPFSLNLFSVQWVMGWKLIFWRTSGWGIGAPRFFRYVTCLYLLRGIIGWLLSSLLLGVHPLFLLSSVVLCLIGKWQYHGHFILDSGCFICQGRGYYRLWDPTFPKGFLAGPSSALWTILPSILLKFPRRLNFLFRRFLWKS